ncbi:hypothetical protein ACFPRA_22730 [Sporosarcina soli]|uniref:Uncharacterized protein n=1 Tax=Sporosarcina soli TaxID=334736 RepID=A0ABW0TQH1_9BACL
MNIFGETPNDLVNINVSIKGEDCFKGELENSYVLTDRMARILLMLFVGQTIITKHLLTFQFRNGANKKERSKMTREVFIKPKQAQAIKQAINTNESKYYNNKSKLLYDFAHSHKNRQILNGDLKSMSFETLYQALTVGFKVDFEHTNTVGDWVILNKDNERKVIQIESIELTPDGKPCSFNNLYGFEHIEKDATAEMIRMEKKRLNWLLMNREPGEIKNGDVIQLNNGKVWKVRKKREDVSLMLEEANRLYREGEITMIYPKGVGVWVR